MNVSVYLVLCVLVTLAKAEDTYRAAIVRDVGHSDIDSFIQAIYEAGRKNVDILVLPYPETLNSKYNFEESVKNIAKAARVSRVYVTTHLQEPHQGRTSLVFNREGAVISLHRKKMNSAANHTNEEINTFATDFGVEFTLVMEEDLVLQDPALMNTRNLIVTGSSPAEIPFLTVDQLRGAWSYVTRSNVVSPAGIHAGVHAGSLSNTQHLYIADLNKKGRTGVLPPPVVAPSPRVVHEHLSQYIIKPLDMEACTSGYTSSVCHNKFCCQFYVKAGFKAGSKSSSINYGLSVYDGVRHFSNKYIGTQTCAVVACAGLYKRSCDLGAQNHTDVIFKEISISANFTPDSALYPMVVSSDVINSSQYTSDVINKQTTVAVHDASVITFGVFARDFTKDHEAVDEEFVDSKGMFNENVQEFIDYVWIRLRILIFVVSIYILEMM